MAKRIYDDPAYKRARKQLIGQPCVVCSEPADTVDHIVPVAAGGDNGLSNLRPMCAFHNSQRGGRLNRGKRRRRRRWVSRGY